MTATPSATALYTAAQVRALDDAFISSGVPAITLMKRAGRAAFAALLQHWAEVEEITVYAGAGNNAGDGFVLAALAAARRIPVNVILVGDPDKLTGAARMAYDYARQEGAIMMPPGPAPSSGVIVDGLLGTGISGEVRPEYRRVIEQINASRLPVLALDLPSGLSADTGAELGLAIKAAVTVTFIGRKRGLYTGRGPALAGAVIFDDLGTPADIYNAVEDAEVISLPFAHLRQWLPAREADAHKGHFGHVLVIGGDTGRGGAAIMAAEAAARTGAGLVSLATRPEHVTAMLSRSPEVMACGVISGQELEPWLSGPTVLVVGPGLGQSPWSEQMLQQALASGLPLVVDADALNLLATDRLNANLPRDNWVLTPHPGEASRLLDTSTQEVQADRFAAVTNLQQAFGGAVILKGAGSLVTAASDPLTVITAGNPGMATGGMGDILSGIIGALLAQGLSPYQAAALGAALHANAADIGAADRGEASLLATDLLPYVGELLSV